MDATTQGVPITAAIARRRRFWVRLGWMALIWLGLNGTDGHSWLVGVPAVLAAAWISVKLRTGVPCQWSLRGGIAFAGFFLWESLRGGWDVARRALSPGLVMSPAIVAYPSHLPAGPARLFFCGAISLLPGTAVVGIEADQLRIHVLDHSPRVEEELRRLEFRVAALFGAAMPRSGEVRS
jgi:multicomponent Na+:H+ antiporter subunit E